MAASYAKCLQTLILRDEPSLPKFRSSKTSREDERFVFVCCWKEKYVVPCTGVLRWWHSFSVNAVALVAVFGYIAALTIV